VTYSSEVAATAVPPTKRRSFDELWRDLDLVPEGYTGEIVDGEITTMPRPDPPHLAVSSDLGVLLGSWFRFGIGGPGGWILLDEPRIRFGDEVRVPDLAGWRVAGYVAPTEGPYVVIPDWLCEVLSPSTARSDRTKKMPLYAKHRVGHVWLIDPVIQTLEVYRLQGETWGLVRTYGADEKVRAEPFDAVELDLSMIWGPKRDAEGL
jgi:Uma2 family endonuclease